MGPAASNRSHAGQTSPSSSSSQGDCRRSLKFREIQECRRIKRPGVALQEAPPLATAAGDVFVKTGLPLSAHTSAVIHHDSDEDGGRGSTPPLPPTHSLPSQIQPAARVEPDAAAQLSCHSALWPLKTSRSNLIYTSINKLRQTQTT